MESELGKFFTDHVIPFASEDLEFQLVIGFHRDDVSALWVTGKNTVRRVYGHEAVGVGDVQANNVLNGGPIVENLAQGVVLACCAVYQAKQNTVGCGKSTIIHCLYDNSLRHIFPDVIHETEMWFQRYLQITHSGLNYCLSDNIFVESEVSKIADWYRDLRREALTITERIANDLRGGRPNYWKVKDASKG